MVTYILRRLLQLIPVLLGVSLLVFLGMHVIPGDVATLLLGDKATAASLARLREQLGLDQPVYVQYLRFLGSALQGDFGMSLRTQQPAWTEVWLAMPTTFELSVLALVFSVILGIPLGIVAATRQYSIFDSLSMVFVLIGVSMPIFWTGLILLMLFGGTLHWFPIGGIIDEGMTLTRITGIHLVDALLTGNGPAFWSVLRHLALPAIALGSIPMATVARMTRGTMLEVLQAGLRAHGACQGTDRTDTSGAPRLPQRPDPRRHRDRAGARAAAVGRGADRDGLCLAWPRTPGNHIAACP